jgi:hypothetical protein
MWRVEDNQMAVDEATEIRLGDWSLAVETPDGTAILEWQADGQSRATGSGWSLEVEFDADKELRLSGRLTNLKPEPRRVEKVILLASQLEVGEGTERWSFFKHGYQSWSETRTFQAEETEQNSWLTPMNVLQSNPRNPPKGRPGAFTSEMFAILGNLEANCYLLVGQAEKRAQFVYVNAWLPSPKSMSLRGGSATTLTRSGRSNPQRRRKLTESGVASSPSQSLGRLATTYSMLEIVHDFGGRQFQPGETVELDAVQFCAGGNPNLLLDSYLTKTARPRPLPQRSPAGWCSWYYYYEKVSSADVSENLAAIASHRPDWQVFVMDDGYTTQIGDWFEVNAKFPQGMRAVAVEIRQAGLRPGIWLAPFVARGNSRLYHEHPEWILRDRKGKALLAGWNPNWGLEGRFYGLDTTHPGFQEYLRQVIHTVVNEWGFDYLKLDFTYGASLPGVAFDPFLTAAQRLVLGYRLVRETAGEDVFLLGCGSPFGPALGWVDGMRIGPDVAPYWDDPLRIQWTRDPHALCTKTAVRSILNRCAFHRRWWLNDPDCLLLRETDTRLTAAERFTLAVAAAVTGGLLFYSDRLARLPEQTWEAMGAIQVIARECDPYPAQVLGFMESEFPPAVWNPAGYLAVFNFSDQAQALGVRVDSILAEGSVLKDAWSPVETQVKDGMVSVATLPAHGAVLFRVAA